MMTSKILLLSANPADTARLQLEKEFKKIKQSLNHLDDFELQQSGATSAQDMRRNVSEYQPNIVHFSGHGEGQNGIVLENEQGERQLLSSKAISEFLALFKGSIQCVLLNACYSLHQAEAIVQHIDYVIGMSHAINDNAAIEFAVAFYESLAAGQSIPKAFDIASSGLNMLNLADADKPVLFQRPELQSAYHHEFQFDAFISYAPEDDSDNWVKTLSSSLQKGLNKELNGISAFCYIPPSQRNIISEQLVERLQNSFLFIAIVSSAWLKNKFCQAEFKSFIERNSKQRVIFIEKESLDKSPDLSTIKAFKLWVMENTKVFPLIYPDQNNPDWEFKYFQKINDCARYLATQLNNQAQEVFKTAAVLAIESDIKARQTDLSFRIFLADNADDVMEQRDELLRYFEQQNISIVSQDSYFHPQEHELIKQLDNDLKHAQLFVQLLSPLKVRRPNGMATPELQLQRAQTLNIPLLQWHQKNANPASLQNLVPEAAFADNLEHFKNYVLQQLQALNTPKSKKTSEDGRLLFINTETIDKHFAEQIGEIAKAQGLYLSYPLQEGDPEEIRADLTENLLDCDAVLMLYGKSPVRWVRSQLRQAIKIARKRQPQLPFWVLCETPPMPKDDLAMPLPEFISIFNAGDETPENLVQRLLNAWEAKQ